MFSVLPSIVALVVLHCVGHILRNLHERYPLYNDEPKIFRSSCPSPAVYGVVIYGFATSSDLIFEQHTRMMRCSFGTVVDILDSKIGSPCRNSSSSPQLLIPIQLHKAMFLLGFYGNTPSLNKPELSSDTGLGLWGTAGAECFVHCLK